MTGSNEAKAVDNIIAAHRSVINSNPAILSLLYDLNLMPEQIATYRDALLMGGICRAFMDGKASAEVTA